MSAARRPVDQAASVRARLRNLARERSEEFQLVLSEFAIERLLYRLGSSRHKDSYILKGAALFKLWSIGDHRATWDVDLLGRRTKSVADVVAVVREIGANPVDDGIVFDLDSVRGEQIRAPNEHAGVRVRLEAQLAGARIPMQVDVGFGDALARAPARQTYPTLLDHPPPIVLAYPREAVVAEKLEAMISLGVTNSRMKDFYDIYTLATWFSFEGATLTATVRDTFARRGTSHPGAEPLALQPEFLAAPERQSQWRAFLRRSRLKAPPDTAKLAADLKRFLGPVLAAAKGDELFTATWPAGGPWQPVASAPERGEDDV